MKKNKTKKHLLYGGLLLLAIIVIALAVSFQGGLFKGYLTFVPRTTTVTTNTNNIQAPSNQFSAGSNEQPVVNTALNTNIDKCSYNDLSVLCSLDPASPKAGDYFKVNVTLCDKDKKILRAQKGQVLLNNAEIAKFPDINSGFVTGNQTSYVGISTGQNGSITYKGEGYPMELGAPAYPLSATCGTVAAITSPSVTTTPTSQTTTTAPLPPANLKTTASINPVQPMLAWTASNGATSYELWRKDNSKNAADIKLKTTSSTSAMDDSIASTDAGKPYTYYVKASNTYGTSGYSNALSFIVPGTASNTTALIANSCTATVNGTQMTDGSTFPVNSKVLWKTTFNRAPLSTETVKLIDSVQQIPLTNNGTNTLSYTTYVTNAGKYTASVAINGTLSYIQCPVLTAK